VQREKTRGREREYKRVCMNETVVRQRKTGMLKRPHKASYRASREPLRGGRVPDKTQKRSQDRGEDGTEWILRARSNVDIGSRNNESRHLTSFKVVASESSRQSQTDKQKESGSRIIFKNLKTVERERWVNEKSNRDQE